ncbi:hypothetical protein HD554DRAFT_2141395 [Boletus coccyginus]|nr:hypothetical protein HD554DRAFT_2141395 [Boletus coccyginus]
MNGARSWEIDPRESVYLLPRNMVVEITLHVDNTPGRPHPFHLHGVGGSIHSDILFIETRNNTISRSSRALMSCHERHCQHWAWGQGGQRDDPVHHGALDTDECAYSCPKSLKRARVRHIYASSHPRAADRHLCLQVNDMCGHSRRSWVMHHG